MYVNHILISIDFRLNRKFSQISFKLQFKICSTLLSILSSYSDWILIPPYLYYTIQFLANYINFGRHFKMEWVPKTTRNSLLGLLGWNLHACSDPRNLSADESLKVANGRSKKGSNLLFLLQLFCPVFAPPHILNLIKPI